MNFYDKNTRLQRHPLLAGRLLLAKLWPPNVPTAFLCH